MTTATAAAATGTSTAPLNSAVMMTTTTMGPKPDAKTFGVHARRAHPLTQILSVAMTAAKAKVLGGKDHYGGWAADWKANQEASRKERVRAAGFGNVDDKESIAEYEENEETLAISVRTRLAAETTEATEAKEATKAVVSAQPTGEGEADNTADAEHATTREQIRQHRFQFVREVLRERRRR